MRVLLVPFRADILVCLGRVLALLFQRLGQLLFQVLALQSGGFRVLLVLFNLGQGRGGRPGLFPGLADRFVIHGQAGLVAADPVLELLGLLLLRFQALQLVPHGLQVAAQALGNVPGLIPQFLDGIQAQDFGH